MPVNARVSGRSAIAISRAVLARDEVVSVRRMRATSILRTIADLGRRLPLVEAVVLADAALHNRGLRHDRLSSWSESHAGERGIRNLRLVLNHVEPKAESPMESRLRVLLVLGGLPRPAAQVSIHDRFGRFVGRPDLYYEAARLGIEYDGGVHRDALAEDNRRQNRLLSVGVRLLRFTAGDVLGNPQLVVAQVRSMLTDTPSAGSDGFRLTA